MNKKIVTQGVCNNCKELISKKSAKSHVQECFAQNESYKTDAFLIKVQWPHKNPIYWIYLAVQFKSTLEHIDDFLRETWLECCSHLSQSTINHNKYSSFLEPDCYSIIEEFPMTISCDKILVPGLKFIHEYDFGSTTELLLEVVGLIKTKAIWPPQRHEDSKARRILQDAIYDS